MAISFNNISSSNRVPLFKAEVDNSRASFFTQNLKAIIIGQSVSTIVETPVLITSTKQAKNLYGVGSMLAIQVAAFFNNNEDTELWVQPLNDVAGTDATGTITYTGTATESGTAFIYVGGVQVQVGISKTDTATTVASNAVIAINKNVDLPVIASNATGTITLTAKNSGTKGNSINTTVNLYPQFETTPSGLSAIVVQMSNGATDPSITTAIAAIGDAEFEYWIQPYADTTSLDALRDELDTRWGNKQLYGHAFTSINDTVAGLDTTGSARNDEHQTIVGYYNSPTWDVVVGASYAAVVVKSLNIDPARPLQTLSVAGIVTPNISSIMTESEMNTLLYSGVSPLSYEGGIARVVSTITTYQTDAFGSADPSYLYVNTLSSLSYITRTIRNMVQTKFSRVKLADDGTSFGAGQAIVTPKIVRGEIVSVYNDLVTLGIVENVDRFIEELVVERDVVNPDRLNVLIVPDLVNGLRTFALKNQFVLQF